MLYKILQLYLDQKKILTRRKSNHDYGALAWNAEGLRPARPRLVRKNF